MWEGYVTEPEPINFFAPPQQPGRTWGLGSYRAAGRGQRDIDLDLDDIGHYRYCHRYWVTVDIDIDIFIDNHFFLIFSFSLCFSCFLLHKV